MVYGNECEKFYCMFRHKKYFHESEEDKEDEDDNDGDDECDEEIDDNNSVKLSEIEPALLKVESAMERVSELLKSSKLKCDKCDFTAKNQNGLNMHTRAKNTDKSN